MAEQGKERRTGTQRTPPMREMKNYHIFILKMNEIDLKGKTAKKKRAIAKKKEAPFVKKKLCALRRRKKLLTTKVYRSEAALFIDRICAIIQKQRFAGPVGWQDRLETRSLLESWKEKT